MLKRVAAMSITIFDEYNLKSIVREILVLKLHRILALLIFL